ncbi:MAG: DUF2282 domain-containing protein [Pseudomonadota bacterium]|nr:DUF2282 domain-containing protein [Pseudomonadota bacterium]
MTSAALPAFAADDMMSGKKGMMGDKGGIMANMEKCYGIAKAGKNDCKTAKNSCKGHTAKDGEGFLMVPKGLCDKLVDGSTQG